MNTILKYIAGALVVVLLITAVLYFTVFDVWTLPSDDANFAMTVEPTLSVGDLVVVRRADAIERGTLVRCNDPDAPGRYVVGRVMAKAGETVAASTQQVRVDGKLVPHLRSCPQVTVRNPLTNVDVVLSCHEEEYAGRSYMVYSGEEFPPKVDTVQPSNAYIVSDNRVMHLDSRDFGQVNGATCQRIVFRLIGAQGFGDSDHRFNYLP